jgi:hypothetical protein
MGFKQFKCVLHTVNIQQILETGYKYTRLQSAIVMPNPNGPTPLSVMVHTQTPKRNGSTCQRVMVYINAPNSDAMQVHVYIS